MDQHFNYNSDIVFLNTGMNLCKIDQHISLNVLGKCAATHTSNHKSYSFQINTKLPCTLYINRVVTYSLNRTAEVEVLNSIIFSKIITDPVITASGNYAKTYVY